LFDALVDFDLFLTTLCPRRCHVRLAAYDSYESNSPRAYYCQQLKLLLHEELGISEIKYSGGTGKKFLRSSSLARCLIIWVIKMEGG